MLPSLLSLSLLGLSVASVLPQDPIISKYPYCDCTGPNIKTNVSVFYDYICGDRRLGPSVLPRKLPLGTFVASYDRFGGLSPDAFIKKWWDEEQKGWKYPDNHGFQLDADNKPMNASMVLEPDMLVDRFGYTTGRYISPASAPFAQRALNPQNLDTPKNAPEFPNNYHVYRVLKKMTVIAGPIAPWFGQPGLGTQFFLGEQTTVQHYIDNGSLKEIDPQELVRDGPGCGFEREDL
ncbi:TNT domain-containing protein [Fusarium sp. LHS14.1]|nr:TNT domain-containing protein [Fusarium sp. LHS14.1]